MRRNAMPKMPKELKGIIPPQRINKKKRKLVILSLKELSP